VLQAPGGARLASEALLRRVVCDEARVQDLDGHGALDEQVRRAVDGAHAALAQTLVEAVLFVEDKPEERVRLVRRGRVAGHGRLGAERRPVHGADVRPRVELPETFRALEHKRERGKTGFKCAPILPQSAPGSRRERKVFLCDLQRLPGALCF
jgi:hypothetical protein